MAARRLLGGFASLAFHWGCGGVATANTCMVRLVATANTYMVRLIVAAEVWLLERAAGLVVIGLL